MTRRARRNKATRRILDLKIRCFTRILGAHDWATTEAGELTWDRQWYRRELREWRKVRGRQHRVVVKYGWHGNLACEAPGSNMRITA